MNGQVEYEVSAPRGVFGKLLGYKGRVGIFLGLFLVLVFSVLTSGVVWDVRIDGADDEEVKEILEDLSAAGLDIGARWNKLDTGLIEINFLAASDSIGWVNINRRGNVAYVRVKDKTVYLQEEEPTGYANLVAARDCVIEDIKVECGYAMVKKGESVRAGEVLISGVIPSELGGGFCYASGQVTGRYSDTVSVSVSRFASEKIYGEKYAQLCKIKILLL